MVTDLLARLEQALKDPVWGSSDWLMNFQAFMEIEVMPRLVHLETTLPKAIETYVHAMSSEFDYPDSPWLERELRRGDCPEWLKEWAMQTKEVN